MTTSSTHSRNVRRRRPLRERAWWCMREMAAFDLDELLLTVADGAERAAADNLRRYIKQLEQHGVVARMRQQRDDANRRYRLAQDLGPKPPVYRRKTHDLLDTNTGHLVSRDQPGARHT